MFFMTTFFSFMTFPIIITRICMCMFTIFTILWTIIASHMRRWAGGSCLGLLEARHSMSTLPFPLLVSRIPLQGRNWCMGTSVCSPMPISNLLALCSFQSSPASPCSTPFPCCPVRLGSTLLGLPLVELRRQPSGMAGLPIHCADHILRASV